MQEKRKNASGSGTVRKKTVIRNGKSYTYWEARYTEGYDLGNGKQIQRSITAKTQKEAMLKLRTITVDLDKGTYTAPNKITLGQWLDTWSTTYITNVKPRTQVIYKTDIRVHIKPAIGAAHLDDLNTQIIQEFYNSLQNPTEDNPQGLCAKTIKNIHGLLHEALQQAVKVGLLHSNPASECTLPRIERKELVPLDDKEISDFLKAIRGERFETLFTVALFTGMREGEVCGLTWDAIDFKKGTIKVNKQLQLHQEPGLAAYTLIPTKNSKVRIITPAPSVMELLEKHKNLQNAKEIKACDMWEDTNLVFTDNIGHHLTKSIVYRDFKKVAASIGRPDARFHDLRHTYAVTALRAGDDIKTVQETMGHATASFTLDVYGHVTNDMRSASANRMEAFIESITEPRP